LLTEFGEERDEVGGVLGLRILPVEVDAVEEAGLVGCARDDVRAGGEVTAEEDVHAGGDKGAARGGLGVGGEGGGAAFEGDEDFEARMETFELGELMEVATKAAGGLVGDAVHRVRRGEDEVEVGVGVSDGAAAAGDEALGVVDLVELRGCAAPDEVLDEEVFVDAPLAEVADDKTMGRRDRVRGGAGIFRGEGDREAERDEQAGEERTSWAWRLGQGHTCETVGEDRTIQMRGKVLVRGMCAPWMRLYYLLASL